MAAAPGIRIRIVPASSMSGVLLRASNEDDGDAEARAAAGDGNGTACPTVPCKRLRPPLDR